MVEEKRVKKRKLITDIAIILLSLSTAIQVKDLFINNDNYTINYEYINTKDMAKAHVASKENNKNILGTLLSNNNLGAVEETTLEETTLPIQNGAEAARTTPKQIWYLPTENGNISQYPNYYHNAYDITSPRGTMEVIHPVANGVVSGIYTDSAGALIVTVLHEVYGVKYTSQYVHLSRYADGLYVGKPVTVNDSLGQMGTTGYSTGVHLHIAVLDCALFDSTDSRCSNLDAWYNYARMRYSQDFHGLGVLVYVPGSWNSR